MSALDKGLEVETVHSNNYSNKTSRMSLYFNHHKYLN